MQTVSTLLDETWKERYKAISRLNIRSSIYDVTNRCNLRCKGCFFFSSDEHKAAPEEEDLARWEAFVEREQARGVNLAILIGGEPTLCLDRVEAFYKRLPTYCATNGLIKVPRERFPGMMVGISLWGDEADEKLLRGRDAFAVSSRNYAGDPDTYYLYTITQLMCAAPSLQVVQSLVAEVQQRCIVFKSAAQRMNRMRRFGRGERLSRGSVTEGHSFHPKCRPSIRPVVMTSW